MMKNALPDIPKADLDAKICLIFMKNHTNFVAPQASTQPARKQPCFLAELSQLKASVKKKAEFLAAEGRNTLSLPTTTSDGFMKIVKTLSGDKSATSGL